MIPGTESRPQICPYLTSAALVRQVAANAPQRNCISLRAVHIGRPNMTRPAEKYFSLIEEKLTSDYAGMFREPGGALKHPFLTPGSDQYADVLWDWDSWLSNVALRQILAKAGNIVELDRAKPFERGCVLNFLEFGGMDCWIPILSGRDGFPKPEHIYEENMRKPCLAQHAAFLIEADSGDAEWLRPKFYFLQAFPNNYRNHDSASVRALFLAERSLDRSGQRPVHLLSPAAQLGIHIPQCPHVQRARSHDLSLRVPWLGRSCRTLPEGQRRPARRHTRALLDERDGFYYSVDLNLLPVESKRTFGLHQGMPRDWPCLIQRIGVWSGFLALWAGIATPEQAQRSCRNIFTTPEPSTRPSASAPLAHGEDVQRPRHRKSILLARADLGGLDLHDLRGLVNYGFRNEAEELATKTVELFGRDLERFGALHQYYQPENGEPILNRGFQNWNYLVLNMIEWLKGNTPVAEFGMRGGSET